MKTRKWQLLRRYHCRCVVLRRHSVSECGPPDLWKVFNGEHYHHACAIRRGNNVNNPNFPTWTQMSGPRLAKSECKKSQPEPLAGNRSFKSGWRTGESCRPMTSSSTVTPPSRSIYGAIDSFRGS